MPAGWGNCQQTNVEMACPQAQKLPRMSSNF